MSDLVNAGLTQREMDVYFVLLATAGNETTRHTISHGLVALDRAPRSARAPARRLRGARQDRDRGDAALGDAGPPLPPHRRASTPSSAAARSGPATRSRPGSSPATATRRCSSSPMRFDVGRAPEPAHDLRARRHPPLPRRAPGQAGDPDHVRGPALARRRARADRTRPSGCARTSSTASSGCRCGCADDRAAPDRPCRPAGRRPRRGRGALVRRSSGCTSRERARRATRALACDDEPCALELLRRRAAPGFDHVAYELAPSCSLEQAARTCDELRRRRRARRRGPADPRSPTATPIQLLRLPRAGVAAGRRTPGPPASAAARAPAQARPRQLPDRRPRRAAAASTREALGMRLTDWLGEDGVWLHINSDHHVMALIDKGQPALPPPRLRRRRHRPDARRARPPRPSRPLARLGPDPPRRRRQHRLLRADRRGGVLRRAVLRHGAAPARPPAAPLARRPLLVEHLGAAAAALLLPLRRGRDRVRAREPRDARDPAAARSEVPR